MHLVVTTSDELIAQAAKAHMKCCSMRLCICFSCFLAFPSNTTGILKNVESRDGNFNSFLQMVGRNEYICYGTKNIQLQCFFVLIPDLYDLTFTYISVLSVSN